MFSAYNDAEAAGRKGFYLLGNYSITGHDKKKETFVMRISQCSPCTDGQGAWCC
jgi:hypothetical protein